MQKWKVGSAVAVLAATVMVGSSVGAFAQMSDGMMMKKKHTHGSATRAKPLTVGKPVMAAPAASPLTAPIGLAAGLAVAPLSGLSQAFGYGPIGGAAKPLPIVARYANSGPVTDSVNQGWAQPNPVSGNGPIYKLEGVPNAGEVSPFALIAAPITAAASIAMVPGTIVGAAVGAPPPPPPVF